ncbi:predicted protein [Postia placenta Mad-698-R]|uniref:Cytochrome P450 n=1 Tax=Postia placenta MAD-698-R-SB12 TaxID=670580 RepID=A0A1X6N334_9APHY|nr:hypothetical protein POSPLADRAFT_1141616 [Postia placenta MAD-698-R-SB12]EED79607.1 predicted protein [Postia placenta Mad-698-R]OSX63014.1 hypothetical protein POSPLADRAFT_1141616 [Postia placenta MAD-698-R-SB12]
MFDFWLCVAIVVAAYALLLRARKKLLPLPPASRPGPGSYLAGEHEPPWKTYQRWSLKIGPLVTVSKLGHPIIVINSAKDATELLDKRSTFASKPRWPMAELLGRQNNVGFQYYGERLKRSRKVLHAALNPDAIANKWSELLDTQSIKLMRQLASDPSAFYSHIQNNIEELVVLFAYGREPEPEYTRIAKAVMEQTSIALQPGRWAVNRIPIFPLQVKYLPTWLPGAGFQRWAKSARTLFYQMTRGPFLEVKAEMELGTATDSFVKHSLVNLGQNRTVDSEDIIMCAAGSLYSAGIETLTSTILTFILFMARHPEVQDRAYKEIMQVVGNHHLPDITDQRALVYVDCVIREVHRMNPAIPLVTHSNTEDADYSGCHIPKQSWIMGNIWSMLHDETAYPRAEEFLPDRYLHAGDGSAPRDPRTLVYGFGRRLCPGLHFANTVVYLVVARTLALYKITPEIVNGEPRNSDLILVPLYDLNAA